MVIIKYLTYLAYLVIKVKEVKIENNVISCDVSFVAMFLCTLGGEKEIITESK